VTETSSGRGRNGPAGGEVTAMDVRLAAFLFGHLSPRPAPAPLATRAARPAPVRAGRRRAEIPASLRRRRAGAGLGPDLTRLASGSREGLHY